MKGYFVYYYNRKHIYPIERESEDIPGNLFDEFARIRRVKFNAEVESVNVRSRITFVDLQLLTEFLTLIEPLLKGVSCYLGIITLLQLIEIDVRYVN